MMALHGFASEWRLARAADHRVVNLLFCFPLVGGYDATDPCVGFEFLGGKLWRIAAAPWRLRHVKPV